MIPLRLIRQISGDQVGTACAFLPVSERGALLGLYRLCAVELSVALFDTASPLVPGNGHADMVRASPLARSRDFRLGLAGCKGQDLIGETG